MREGRKTLIAVLAALLLAVGLAACGGGDSDGSSSTAADAGSTAQPQGKSGSDASKKAGDDEGKSGAGDGTQSNDSGSGSDASDFTPKQHSDSGGGSQELKVKGGDNSVQEFGQEADTSEFDDAAAALHNFLDARAQGNWAAACEYMSKGMIESFEQLATHASGVEAKGCAGILEKLTNPAAKQLLETEAAKADVRSLRIEGEQAFVIYIGIDGAVLGIPMANEDGAWKVASLAGTPLS